MYRSDSAISRTKRDKAFLIANILMSLFAATLLGCSAGNSTTPLHLLRPKARSHFLLVLKRRC